MRGMEDTSRFRPAPYRKPIWLRVIVPLLLVVLSLTISQVVLRDNQVMGAFTAAGRNVAQFMAVEMAYRKAQEAGVSVEVEALKEAVTMPPALFSAGSADSANAVPEPEPVAEEAALPGIRVNRLVTGDRSEIGTKRIRVGQGG